MGLPKRRLLDLANIDSQLSSLHIQRFSLWCLGAVYQCLFSSNVICAFPPVSFWCISQCTICLSPVSLFIQWNSPFYVKQDSCRQNSARDDLVVGVHQISVNEENKEQEANRQLSCMFEFMYILCTHTKQFDHRNKCWKKASFSYGIWALIMKEQMQRYFRQYILRKVIWVRIRGIGRPPGNFPLSANQFSTHPTNPVCLFYYWPATDSCFPATHWFLPTYILKVNKAAFQFKIIGEKSA